MRVLTVRVDLSDYEYAVENYEGWCTTCESFTRPMTEPDINPGEEGYECPECDNNTVAGAEQALLLGLIVPSSRKRR